MKRYSHLLIILLLAVCLAGCGSNNSESVGQYKGEEIDLADYLYTDVNETVDGLGGFAKAEINGHECYENDTAILYYKDVNGTDKISEIVIKGPGNYNLFGMYYDMPTDEAVNIINTTCTDVTDTGTKMSGKVKDSEGVDHNLEFVRDSNPNFISRISYS